MDLNEVKIKLKKINTWSSEENKDKNKLEKDIDYLVSAKRHFSKLYGEGRSLLSDLEYDELIINTLKFLDPDNEALKEVGAPPSDELIKVKLPQVCGSLENMYYNDGSITKWMNVLLSIVGGRIVVQTYTTTQKLDGITMYIVYKNGKLNKAYKRGNGIIGTDIIRHALLMPSVPKTVDTTELFAVRGEVVMEEELFINKYKKKEDKKGYRTSRNMVAGMFNKKHPIPEVMKDIDLVVYEVKYPEDLDKIDQLKIAEEKGFNVALYEEANSINDEILKEILIKLREKSKYLMDGIVIDINSNKFREMVGFETNSINPKYARAFKMHTVEDEYETTIVDYAWAVSKNYLVKPRVLVDMVEIKGVHVSCATGKNAKTLLDLGAGIGAKIIIIRAGDTIPDILKVIEKTPVVLPTECPSCNTTLKWTQNSRGENVDLYCPNEDCSGRNYKRIIAFFRGINTEEFNSGVAKKCIEAGYGSCDEIIRMSINDFMKLENIQKKSATTLYNNIKVACSNTNFPDLMHSTGFFGRSLGSTKIASIIENLGEEKTLNLSNYEKNIVVDKICVIKGFEQITAELFYIGIKKFNEWFTNNKKYFNFNNSPIKNEIISDKLKDQVIVFTGFRDTDLKKIIKKNEGTVVSGFSKKVTLVIAKDVSNSSGTIKKARSLNIPIKNKESFISDLLI